MKKIIYSLLVITTFLACSKENVVHHAAMTLESRTNVLTATEEMLRRWTEWNMKIDPINDPGLDTDGSMALQNQPFVPGTLFLTGSNSSDLVERNITVSISDYQKIFYPTLAAFWWYTVCDPLEKNDNGKLKPGSVNTQALFTGKDHGLDITWDGEQLAPNDPKSIYFNAGIWQSDIHPGYYNYCNLLQPVDLHLEAFVVEIPLTVGTHTLIAKGFISSGKYHQVYFSNHVKFNITVTP